MAEPSEHKKPKVIAACRACGRGFVSFKNWDKPCPLCQAGYVEAFEVPVENLGQRFPEWVKPR